MRGFLAIPHKHKYSAKEKRLFWKRMSKRWRDIDTGNTKELKKLLQVHAPWFTISKFGKVTSSNAWLLVQHADHDRAFQKQILKVLAKLHKKGESSPQNYAYLYDRVAT
ncbi:MAG: DUF6624 domain-containing protein [Myxococcota bacterium]